MSKSRPLASVTGPLPNELANAISDAIAAALRKGMQIDEAACIAVGVAGDYARGEYGDGYLWDLANVMLDRQGKPMPEQLSDTHRPEGER